MSQLTVTQRLLILAAVWFLFSGGTGGGIDTATYVYEKNQNEVPAAVASGLSKLNEKGIRATKFDQDTVDGNGEVPDQYKTALEAAKKAGLPSLVALSKGKVRKVVKDPKTEEQVLEVAP